MNVDKDTVRLFYEDSTPGHMDLTCHMPMATPVAPLYLTVVYYVHPIPCVLDLYHTVQLMLNIPLIPYDVNLYASTSTGICK